MVKKLSRNCQKLSKSKKKYKKNLKRVGEEEEKEGDL
jgi:hypothetical protein